MPHCGICAVLMSHKDICCACQLDAKVVWSLSHGLVKESHRSEKMQPSWLPPWPYSQQLACECLLQILGEEWRRVALDYQAKVHRVAIIILKAIFIGLGRDDEVIEEVRT